MTDEELADKYCDEEVFFDITESGEKLYTQNDLKQAFLAGLKTGKNMAEADLATVAYMQGAERQKKKVDTQLTKAMNHIHRLLVLLTEGKRSYAVIDEARAFLKDVLE